MFCSGDDTHLSLKLPANHSEHMYSAAFVICSWYCSAWTCRSVCKTLQLAEKLEFRSPIYVWKYKPLSNTETILSMLMDFPIMLRVKIVFAVSSASASICGAVCTDQNSFGVI